MKIKRRYIILMALTAILAIGSFYIPSLLSENAFKVALNLNSIPKSASSIRTSSTGFTDELITAYFESSKEDMEAIVTARDYRNMDEPPIDGVSVQERFPLHINRYFPDIPSFEIGEVYRWDSPSHHAFSLLWVSSTSEKAFVLYSVD